MRDSAGLMTQAAQRARLRDFVEALEANPDLRVRLLRVLGTLPAGWGPSADLRESNEDNSASNCKANSEF